MVWSVLPLKVAVYEVSSALILEVGVPVTITVVKLIVTVIVKLEQEEWLVKGDGNGNEVIIFDVIKEGKDDRRGNKGGCEEKDNDGDKIMEDNRYEDSGDGDRQLLPGSKRCNEAI